MQAILVLNAGSSSIKFAAYEHAAPTREPVLLARGRIAKAGLETEMLVRRADGEVLEQSRAPGGARFDHDRAMARLFDWLAAHRVGLVLAAIGHRVVHGGSRYRAPVRVDDAVLSDLDALAPLAPLHQPHNLAPIRHLRARLPDVPQVACFDTAFHATQPAVATRIALPREVTDAGVRRYGFHGLSYEYIASRLPAVLGDAACGRVVVAHLGNGASLCAMRDGRSVGSSMGFSALDGLVMGTRSGALDPGVVLYLIEQRGMSAAEVGTMLYERSGLLGVSGIGSDMRVLLASADAHAKEAVELFVYRLVGEIGRSIATMGGIDSLVFTAGIGENSAEIRTRVCASFDWCGVAIDPDANARNASTIHAAGSRVRVAVVPTDEERMIAIHTARCCA
ncbi:MAG: acetate/propionate family kinase [Lautropia sp.]